MDLNTHIKCSEIHAQLTDMDIKDVWRNYLGWVKTLGPFWEKTISEFARHINLSEEKRNQYLTSAVKSFDYFDDWKNKRIKYVNARRKEIDSSVSFIRNTALQHEVTDLLIAPVSRNVAGLLRTCIYISTEGYRNEQIPLLVAKSIYGLAECRTFFPVDSSDLIPFLPPGKGLDGSSKEYSEDNYHLMMEIGGDKLGIKELVLKVNEEASKIWNSFNKPIEMSLPDELWKTKTDRMAAELHYAGMRAFHGKDTKNLNS